MMWVACAGLWLSWFHSLINKLPWPKVGQRKLDLLILRVDFTILSKSYRFYNSIKVRSILWKVRSILSESCRDSGEMRVCPSKIPRTNFFRSFLGSANLVEFMSISVDLAPECFELTLVLSTTPDLQV